MNLTGTRYVVDTNIWIDYFWNGRFKEELLGNDIETPAVVLVELAGHFMKNSMTEEEFSKCIGEMLRIGIVTELGLDLALKAAKARKTYGLPAMDAIIYAYADEGKRILTQDADLKGLPNVEYRKK